jgi:hypothetical protein
VESEEGLAITLSRVRMKADPAQTLSAASSCTITSAFSPTNRTSVLPGKSLI